MSEGGENTFEYTRPKLSKEEMLKGVLSDADYGSGVGFINVGLSSKDLVEGLLDLDPEYRRCAYTELKGKEETNRGAKVLFITDVPVVTEREYERAQRYKEIEGIGKVIFLTDNNPNLGEYLGQNVFPIVLEDSDDGFFVTKFKGEPVVPHFPYLRNGGVIWHKAKKEHYYQEARNLSQLFWMVRDRSKDLSKTDERKIWGEYGNIYYWDFERVLPGGMYDWLKKKKNGDASVIDLFADPAMVRNLKKAGFVSTAVAVGSSDSRSEKERREDEDLGVTYFSEVGGSGVWSGGTWAKIRKYIENTPELQENGGFDLVIARPVRGWYVGSRPAPRYSGEDSLAPPFELQYVILSRMWGVVGHDGSLVAQMPSNSINEMQLYSEQLVKSGFSVISDICKSRYDVRNILRIDKNENSPRRLPRPEIFKAPGGIK